MNGRNILIKKLTKIQHNIVPELYYYLRRYLQLSSKIIWSMNDWENKKMRK